MSKNISQLEYVYVITELLNYLLIIIVLRFIKKPTESFIATCHIEIT